MKRAQTKSESPKIRLPRKSASYAELSDFFDRHDGVDLMDHGIMEIDPDRDDLERMLLEYWKSAEHEAVKYSNSALPPSV